MIIDHHEIVCPPISLFNSDFVYLDIDEYACYECHRFSTRTKNNWLDHMEKFYKNEFNKLVENMRSAREILNDAVQNITDDEVIKKGELQI
jgi:hypothetical protein